MKVFIEETATGKKVEANILPATKRDMPLKKDGWQFNWRELERENEEAMFFKLVRSETPKVIEGILMLSLMMEGQLVLMNNIETAPSNFGKKKKYDMVIGCLISYACLKSFELGKDAYKGFLSFESKTSLIDLYHRKYGATLALGQKMFFDDIVGKKLIKKYLEINVDKIKFNHA